MSSQSNHHHAFRSFAIKHPYRAFLFVVLPLSFLLVGGLLLNKLPSEPGLLVLTYAGLLGMSVLITYWNDGKSGVKKLMGRVTKWRVGIGYYLLALLAIPVVTILLGMITGNFKLPAGGWEALGMKFLITFLSGALIINLWEETGWAGFFQTRIMKEKGLLKGSFLTSLGFAGVHLPLALGMSSQEMMLYPFIVFAFAPFLRYLIGIILLETGGSILLVGLLHASFNASNRFGIIEVISATILITFAVAGVRKLQGKPLR